MLKFPGEKQEKKLNEMGNVIKSLQAQLRAAEQKQKALEETQAELESKIEERDEFLKEMTAWNLFGECLILYYTFLPIAIDISQGALSKSRVAILQGLTIHIPVTALVALQVLRKGNSAMEAEGTRRQAAL